MAGPSAASSRSGPELSRCGIALGVDLVEDLEPDLACRSAGWFWHVNGLNQCADTGGIARATLRINGGTNGLQERKRLWAVAKLALRDAAA
jgi:putative chitinase